MGKITMRSKHVDELLRAAKLASLAEGDTIGAYLIDMALLHNAQNLTENRKPAAVATAA